MNYTPQGYSREESDVKLYFLPDPLLSENGVKINSPALWQETQRKKILDLFKKTEYGEILPPPDKLSFTLLTEKKNALNGLATRKEIRIECGMNSGKSFSFVMLLYIPNFAEGKVPCFLGLNFQGNHTTTLEEDVLPTGYKINGMLFKKERGAQAARWCHERVLQSGYATATICYHDIYPDTTLDAERRSVFSLFPVGKYEERLEKYSVIGAWAWGLSRALDCLEKEERIDSKRVAVHGHSRLGKASLWAGAIDERFALVISNDSGCGGAALHKRKLGENLSQHFENHVNGGVPIWFVKKCESYIFKEESLPLDQHELLALIAPRPLALGTATLDLDADPFGEYLAMAAASPVYELFGNPPFKNEGQMLAPDTSQEAGLLHIHYRPGKHDHTPRDWDEYLSFAGKYL